MLTIWKTTEIRMYNVNTYLIREQCTAIGESYPQILLYRHCGAFARYELFPRIINSLYKSLTSCTNTTVPAKRRYDSYKDR